jgi:murein tripeptide amidase MpaA
MSRFLPFASAASALVLLLSGSGTKAAPAAEQPVLPPELPWNGSSRALVAHADDAWITPAERSGLTASPRYDETLAYLRRLAEAAPEIQLVSLGKSFEGRDIWLAVASAEGAATPAALRAGGKPTVLAQAGIHSGEIDGKDAGLMLLRDMSVRATKRELLRGANFLFVPIFNVDGHERASRFGRINQRGPAEMGWRTNARNLNLNRDYAKLDTPEMRALTAALGAWQPDLYLDLHVTDGVDYQYDVTFTFNRGAWSPAAGAWLDGKLAPALLGDLRAAGHVPIDLYINAVSDLDLGKGINTGPDQPRFSTGYGDARHLPTVLVENHSLKPYPQRVLGMYVLLESALRTASAEAASLRAAIAEDRARRGSSVPLSWKTAAGEPEMLEFLGVESRQAPSAISGGVRVEWLGRPVTLQIPLLRQTEIDASITRPRAYVVPPAWPEVIERLVQHGIAVERFAEAREIEVEMYTLADPAVGHVPFEGHVRVTATPVAQRRRELFPAGSVRVSTDQPLGTLAVLLLEPASPDSFFQWGFFLEALQQTEYVEGYVMEPMAERMLAEDPELAEEFRRRLLEDEAFRSSPDERLQWFYSKTPFFDQRWRLYPVAREI